MRRSSSSMGWRRPPPPWLLLWGLVAALVTRAGAFHSPRPQPLHRLWHRPLLPPRPAAPSSSDPPAAPPSPVAADTVAGLAAQVRKAARAKPTDDGGHEALRGLTDRLAAALQPRARISSSSSSSSKNKKKHKGGDGSHDHPPPLRLETRRLVLAAVGDCARANADPGPAFWPALGRWLQPVASLPTRELAALTLALATLDVPLAAQPLWEELVAAVAHRAKGVGAREAGQLRKALTLLLGPGGGFRVGPQPTLAWLLPLLRAREEQDRGSEEEEPRALLTRRREQGRVRRPVAAAASSSSSETAAASAAATTFSALHRRLLDLLQGAGCAVEAEAAYQGLNLDIVLYPPPARGGLTLKPLVIEVDGPQHFLQGDPARPTGATAARRRLLRAATDAFAGLVSITYADEGAAEVGGSGDGDDGEESSLSSPRGRLLALLEREAEAQAGVCLAAYRVDGGAETELQQEQEGQWALARRFLLAPSAEALVAEVRRCEAEMDVGAWAVAVGRMGGFLRHGHRFHGRSTAARATRRGLLIGDRGVLRSEQQALGLVAVASFPALGTLLGALADDYGTKQEDRAAALALAGAAVVRVDALLVQSSSSSSSSSDQAGAAVTATATPTALVAILRALVALSYRVGANDDGPSSPFPHQRLLPLLATKAGQDRFDAHGLASLLASLGRVLHPLPPDAHSHLATLCAAAERRLPSARRTDLLLLAQGLAGLRRSAFSPPDGFTTALVAAAGRAAPALPLVPALALLTLREPAAADDDGGNGDLMSQRERRRTPQWALVGEVRARLRALSPAGLGQTLVDVAGGEEAEGNGDEDDASYLPPPRAFLVMLCSEVYKRREQLSARERARAVGVLRGSRLGAIYDPGPRFWQRMASG